jgi:dihydroorotate dehydrogenase electron transfer subunit
MPVIQTLATVVDNYELIKDHRVMVCDAPDLAVQAHPGHFVNALASETISSILRKPFSIFSADPASGRISILYQIHGATTLGMSRKIAGDIIDLVGPLGGSLFVPDPRPNAHHIMVGGGYGVPPLVFLAKRLRERGVTSETTFIVGARSKDLLLCESDLAGLDVTIRPTTEDGSHGTQGRVTDVLRELLAREAAIYTCGPTGMMQAVGEMCIEANVPCQVSLEVPMPCGVGVCMGCVVDLADGRRVRACTEGPVFDARKVTW